MDLLLHCKHELCPDARMTFGEVCERILGTQGKRTVNVFLVGTQLGFCCVYITVVATNVHAILPER
jgi:hypothetical protein